MYFRNDPEDPIFPEDYDGDVHHFFHEHESSVLRAEDPELEEFDSLLIWSTISCFYGFHFFRFYINTILPLFNPDWTYEAYHEWDWFWDPATYLCQISFDIVFGIFSIRIIIYSIFRNWDKRGAFKYLKEKAFWNYYTALENQIIYEFDGVINIEYYELEYLDYIPITEEELKFAEEHIDFELLLYYLILIWLSSILAAWFLGWFFNVVVGMHPDFIWLKKEILIFLKTNHPAYYDILYKFLAVDQNPWLYPKI